MKNILLIGGGGHCASVLDSLLSAKIYDEIGIVDFDKTMKIEDVQVVGNDDDLENLREKYEYAFVTVGSVGKTYVRENLYSLLSKYNYMIPNIIDASAIISKSAELGNGIFVGKKAVINARTKIRDCAIINTGSVIEHDCEIGEFVHVSPAAVLCGNVRIGDRSHIGANSVVIQGIDVAQDVVVGAGAVVVNDIEASGTVVGNPALDIVRR